MRIADLAVNLAEALELSEERATQLVRAMVPVIGLGDLSRPWNSDAFQERWASAREGVSGVAAQTSKIQLSNGYNVGTFADTGVLVVLTDLWIRAAADGEVYCAWALNANEVGSIGNTRFTDRRLHPKEPAASVRSGTGALTTTDYLTGFWVNPTNLDISYHFPFRAILGSGQGLLFQHSVQNTNMQIGFQWFEVNAPLLAI